MGKIIPFFGFVKHSSEDFIQPENGSRGNRPGATIQTFTICLQIIDIKTSFEDMLAMLRKKVQEKDDEIKRLQQENAKLKEALPEGNVLEETFNRR